MGDFDYAQVKEDRDMQWVRLTDAGFDVDGGGVDMVTGGWDLFVYPKGADKAVILRSVEDVDTFIDFGRHEGRQTLMTLTALCRLTGHRVLRPVRSLFYDPIGGEPVWLFECRHGNKYMAGNLWRWSRLGTKVSRP